MPRKTITIESETYTRLVAAQRPGETFSQTIDRLARMKTYADALAFYRRKTTWLSPRKIALIERLRARKQRLGGFAGTSGCGAARGADWRE